MLVIIGFVWYSKRELMFEKIKERKMPPCFAGCQRHLKVFPMKNHNTNYAQISRLIWNYDISDKAKLLFFWLNELEQRYTGTYRDYFFRSDEQLASDLHWNIKTVKTAKAELKNTDLIRCSRVRWYTDDTHTKLSTKYVTGYRILK